MDRPSGSWIIDQETGELTPNLADEAMKARQPIKDSGEQGAESQGQKNSQPSAPRSKLLKKEGKDA